MGIKKNIPTRRGKRDLTMDFDESNGLLSVQILHAQFKNRPVIFTINGDNEYMDIDENGKGEFQFDSSDPPVLYLVKILNSGPLTDDQRLAFLY